MADIETGADTAVDPARAVLFKVLADAGINEVVISFSGGGDSGAIDGSEAFMVTGEGDARAVTPALLPETQVNFYAYDGELEAMTVGEALERLGDQVLEGCGLDWYNNEGGQGEIIVYVDKQIVRLEIGINSMSTEDYTFENV